MTYVPGKPPAPIPQLEKPIFHTGDVVQLRSGGPLLTITHIDSYGGASFIYFNTISGVFEKSTVKQDCLKGGIGRPELPQDASTMRSTSVTKF